MAEEHVPQKSDYLYDTIVIGMITWLEALTPILIWFLFECNRPGMSMFDSSNDWYYISWWTMWIGNLVAFAVPAIMWIPSYFSDVAAHWYGLSWIWAMGIGGLTTVFVWTSLLVSGIEWKDWKEIWVVFVLYTVAQMVVQHMGMKSTMGSKIWYMWNTMEKYCAETDEEGNCVWPEGEHPADLAKMESWEEEDWEKEDWDM